MIKPLQAIIFTILLFITIETKAQTTINKNDFAVLFKPHNIDSTWIKSKNKSIMHVFYIIYKKYISSQDISTCRFSPSCSSYGMLAVQKKGVIFGVIDTFDRLTRCNSYNYNQYKYDPIIGAYLDKP